MYEICMATCSYCSCACTLSVSFDVLVFHYWSVHHSVKLALKSTVQVKYRKLKLELKYLNLNMRVE